MIHPVEPMKKWRSEPALLGDYEDSWIKESDNVEENGVSFTEEVNQPSLVNVTKQRAQLRPKRRPPSRDFVKSKASMDFNISVPEEIKEEDEEKEETEKKTDEKDDSKKTANVVKTPIKPTPPPKPVEAHAWKLPTPEPGLMLRKTPSDESESKMITNDEDFSVKTPEISEKSVASPDSPRDKKDRKRHKRFKFHKFKFHRNRRGKEKHENEKDTNSNLTELHYMSADSGSRPLGDNTPKRWPHRRRHKSKGDRRRLSWLLGLFNKRKDSSGNPDTSGLDHPASNDGNQATSNENGEDKANVNGNVSEIKIEQNFTNGTALNHDNEGQNPETVSDLRKKFERISAAF